LIFESGGGGFAPTTPTTNSHQSTQTENQHTASPFLPIAKNSADRQEFCRIYIYFSLSPRRAAHQPPLELGGNPPQILAFGNLLKSLL